MQARAALIAIATLAGCGHKASPPPVADMAPHAGPDMTVPPRCNPVDNIVDPPCSKGCPANTIGTVLFTTCLCYPTCRVDTQCPCDRLCDELLDSDGGVVGKTCLPGNSVGTRCGQDAATHKFFGSGFCAQGMQCIAADTAKLFRYCMPECNTQADCPAQTTCLPTFDGSGNATGNVCAYVSNDKGNKNLGQACTVGVDVCKTGQLCDGVCRPQCDGPGASCASGTCTAVVDPTHGDAIVGYVCK
jgi:hypothetical protein